MAELLTPSDVAARWLCTPGHVRELIRKGRLPAERRGARDIKISLADVQEFETASPPRVSQTIDQFILCWSRALDDPAGRLLVPSRKSLIGTAGTDEQEMRRSWLALDWYCRVSLPLWLRLAGLPDEAAGIEATAPIIDSDSGAAAEAAVAAADRTAADAWVPDFSGAPYRDTRKNYERAAGFAAFIVSHGSGTARASWLRDQAHSATLWAVKIAEANAGERMRSTVERLQRSARDLIDRMASVMIERPA